MPTSIIPPSDEPADFRHQARDYARYRRGYSATLYDAIEASAGTGAQRLALDLACGTGLVVRDLAARGWRVVGLDLSAPMLAEITDRPLGLVRGSADAIPMPSGTVDLVTCGMGFHWMPADATLEEVARVLAPGGQVALFWRYPLVDEPVALVVRRILAEMGYPVPDGAYYVHPSAPFATAALETLAALRLETTLRFTCAEYCGYLATVEVIRRYTGADHARFLQRVNDALATELPAVFEERNEEFLFLARRPAG